MIMMSINVTLDPDEETIITIPIQYNEGIRVEVTKIPQYRYRFSLNETPNERKIAPAYIETNATTVIECYEPHTDGSYYLCIDNAAKPDFLDENIAMSKQQQRITVVGQYNTYPLEEVSIPFTSKIDGIEKTLVILIGYTFGMIVNE